MPFNIQTVISTMQRYLKWTFMMLLVSIGPAQGTDTSNYEGFLPKHITGVRSFLAKHPDFDGQGIRVAVLDSGVDPGAPGLSRTSQGLPKIIDILDATGSGDVDTSATAQASEDGTLKGLTGRILKLKTDWLKEDRTFHLGMVRVADLVTDSVWNLYQEKIRKEMTQVNKTYIESIEAELETLDSNPELTKEAKEIRQKDLKTRIKLLKKMEEEFSPASPVFDCLVFEMDDAWKVVVDTNENGDLSDDALLGEYSLHQEYATLGPDALVHFGVHVYQDGRLLSIVIPSSPHGTHVAGMIGAYYPESPERNGIAPGIQIVSIKIGDTHLDGMETGIALQRALRMVKELDCDLINMSYGEPTSTPNEGWFIDQVNELVREHQTIFVASAGNAGPALSTVGAPGGTSSSILAIGAYVHTSMMPIQYGISHAPQSNLYTWSSRGPALDGDLGVNLCAPGGAFAPVPTSSLQPAMQMNGTSMASPYACGSIALILSGLKQQDIPWQSYDVKTALEHTAEFMPQMDRFSQGAGLIQVEKAFETLKAPNPINGLWGYEIRNASQSSGRGILIREWADLKTPTRQSIRIEPVFHEDAPNIEKAHFEVWAKLESDADWLTFPDSVLIHQKQGSLNVLVDARHLSPGAYSTYIQGTDMHSNKPLFRIPAHVMVPYKPLEGPDEAWTQSLTLHPGDVSRHFLSPPAWAQWAECTIKADSEAPLDRLALHTTQITPKERFNAHEWKRYISTESLDAYRTSIPVIGNRTMEWTLASYWSNRSDMNLQIHIAFRGLGQFQESIVLPAGDSVVPISVQGIQNRIHLKPKGQLTHRAFSLLPLKTSIQASSDPRDVLVKDATLSRLEMVYQWKNEANQPITLEWNGLSEVLYDSPYSSMLWRLDDELGRRLTKDDAWTDPVSIPKGFLTLTLHIWHEKKEILERLQHMPVTLRQPLDRSIPIQVKNTLSSAATLKEGGNPSRTMNKGETENLWLFVPGNKVSDQEPDGIPSIYHGNIQWIDSEKHHGGTLNTSVTWIPAHERPKRSDEPSTKAASTDLKEAIWQTQIQHLESLANDVSAIESFNTLFETLRKERPYSAKLSQIMLDHLDGKQRAYNLDSLISHLNSMLADIRVSEIRDHFAWRQALDTKEARAAHEDLSQQRSRYLDLLQRKARALATKERISNIRTNDFEETMHTLRHWVDTSEGDYRHLELWESQRDESFGEALQRLNQLISEDPDQLALHQKRIQLLTSMQWPAWVDQIRLKMHALFQNQCISLNHSE